MEKKLTAVQWLIQTMCNSQGMEQPQIDEVFQQALRMERQQIEEAYFHSLFDVSNYLSNETPNYYTKTFKP
jgi:hypothetical protein